MLSIEHSPAFTTPGDLDWPREVMWAYWAADGPIRFHATGHRWREVIASPNDPVFGPVQYHTGGDWSRPFKMIGWVRGPGLPQKQNAPGAAPSARPGHPP